MFDAVRPIVARQGPRICVKYYEEATVNKTRLNAEWIHRSHDFLHAMHGLSPKLCFERSQMKRVGVMIAEHFANKWNFDEQTVASFGQVFALRARNMMHVVATAERKNRCTPWVKQLPWNTLTATDKEPDGSSDECALMRPAPKKRCNTKLSMGHVEDPRATYEFGWCREVLLPFRLRHGAPRAEMELGLPVEVFPGQRATDPVVGVWRDGMKHPIADITCEMWKVLSSGRSSRQDSSIKLWEGERVGKRHKLVLAQRVDRKLLVSFCEQ